jgi:hypothetical protein
LPFNIIIVPQGKKVKDYFNFFLAFSGAMGKGEMSQNLHFKPVF